MAPPKLVYLIDSINSMTIPFEVISRIDKSKYKTVIVTYNITDEIKKTDAYEQLEIIGISPSKWSLNGINELATVIRDISPDILHVHGNYLGILGRLMGKFFGVPGIVDTEHSPHDRYPFHVNFLNGLTLPLSDVIISNSQCTEDSFFWWEEWFTRNIRKTVIYNGIDVKDLQQAQRNHKLSFSVPFNKDDFVVGTVGRLIEEKNHETLMKAFKLVTEDRSDAKLIIVGDGPEENNLKSLSRKLGINDKIFFTGFIPKPSVYNILEYFDLFVMVSYWEGFCNAVVEAMVSGLPMIVSKIKTFEEIVGEYGVFVDPADKLDVMAKIKNVICDTKSRTKIGKQLSRRAKERFTLQKTVENHERLYNDLLKR